MYSKILIPALLVVALQSFQSRGADLSPDQVKAAIQEALSQRHPTDTPQWWASLGPQAPGVILEMIGTETSTYHRVRLIEALGWYPDSPKATEHLKETATRTDLGPMRNAAIKSIANSRGTQEVEYIAKFLDHQDPQTRLVAAQSLKSLNDSRATTLVSDYLKREKTPWIASRLEGRFPKTKEKLKPVSSNMDLSESFVQGKWKGFLVSPGSTLVLENSIAELSIQRQQGQGFSGELLVQKPGPQAKPETVKVGIAAVSVRDGKLSFVLNTQELKGLCQLQGPQATTQAQFEGPWFKNPKQAVLTMASSLSLCSLVLEKH